MKIVDEWWKQPGFRIIASETEPNGVAQSVDVAPSYTAAKRKKKKEKM